MNPPSSLPDLPDSLKQFIQELGRVPPSEIRTGDFHFTIPEEIENEYHYLSEYRAKHVRDAFCFGWAGYKRFAWGADEVHPITGGRGDNWGGLGMTLLDSIDTLGILKLDKEFEIAKQWIKANATFDLDILVSVFETNIRVVGGMLGAYEYSKDPIFLEKAEEMATRLLPAFNTESGYPKVL